MNRHGTTTTILLGAALTLLAARAGAVSVLYTVPGPAVVIGSGDRLTDSATLSGAIDPIGTITFELTNGVVAVDVETVTVSGNGTYATPTGYSPLAVGDYQWSVFYSGDLNNQAAADNTETGVVRPASTVLTTTPGGTVTLGSGISLTDSDWLRGSTRLAQSRSRCSMRAWRRSIPRP
jgi:hypothetical protein